ncbi:Heat shock 70 kDa protein 12B, partial [Lachnellula willkommii]
MRRDEIHGNSRIEETFVLPFLETSNNGPSHSDVAFHAKQINLAFMRHWTLFQYCFVHKAGLLSKQDFSMSDQFEQETDRYGMTTVYQSDDQLVVALDFGTTYSGIAYAFANGSKPTVISIEDWPGLEGYQQPKVPTLISYAANGTFTWGGQKHAGDVVQGVKLLLDPDQQQPIYLPNSTARSDLKRLKKPPVDVAADFIKAMYQHAMAKIESQIPVEYLRICQKQFVLSVPAVWSDKAKDLTLKAAKQAGIHPVSLIKEPEAAAIFTPKTFPLSALSDPRKQVGDAFVICDAGGGTVDLISYEITQLKPSLELKELVPGKGGMAGSLGLNRRFEAAVKEIVGEDQYFSLRKTRGFELAVQQFDRSVKTAFRGDLDEDYYINFPMADLNDDPDNNLESNCWNMKGVDVKSIFEPLINDIERLVDDQVNLVKVKRLSDNHPKADEIKMTWYIHRGEDLEREQTIVFQFFRTLPDGFSDSRLVFDDDLIQSENNVAPNHPSPGATRTNCTLTADLRGVDQSHFKKRTGVDGQLYVDIHYDLVITIKPAVMKFSLEVDVWNSVGVKTWVGLFVANLALAMFIWTIIFCHYIMFDDDRVKTIVRRGITDLKERIDSDFRQFEADLDTQIQQAAGYTRGRPGLEEENRRLQDELRRCENEKTKIATEAQDRIRTLQEEMVILEGRPKTRGSRSAAPTPGFVDLERRYAALQEELTRAKDEGRALKDTNKNL